MPFEFSRLTLPSALSCTLSVKFIKKTTSRMAPIYVLSREESQDFMDQLGKSEGLTSRSHRSQMCFPACLLFHAQFQEMFPSG